MTSRIARIAVIAALGSRATLGTAHAQSAEAETLFGEGDKLMTAGKVAQACEAFDASNRIEPRAGTLIRLGQCREQNHQLASAWSAYKDALARAKDPNKRQIAAARIAAIEPRLSYLTVAVADISRIDGLAITRNGKPLDPALWNRPIPIDGGDYEIGGTAAGYRAWKAKVTVALEAAKVTVDVPRLEPRTKPASVAKLESQTAPADAARLESRTPPPDAPSGEPRARPVDAARREPRTRPADAAKLERGKPVDTAQLEPRARAEVAMPAPLEPRPAAIAEEQATSGGLTGRRKVALGVAGVGGIAIATGVVFGLQARTGQDDAHMLCPEPASCAHPVQANAMIEQARSKALLANISYGVGAAAVIGAAVLWLTGAPPERATISVAPRLGGATGIDVTVRF